MLDQIISTNIIALQSESLTKLMILITNLGDKYTLATFTIILLGIFVYKKQYMKAQILSLTMLSGLLVLL
jgi:hypothetical protein